MQRREGGGITGKARDTQEETRWLTWSEKDRDDITILYMQSQRVMNMEDEVVKNPGKKRKMYLFPPEKTGWDKYIVDTGKEWQRKTLSEVLPDLDPESSLLAFFSCLHILLLLFFQSQTKPQFIQRMSCLKEQSIQTTAQHTFHVRSDWRLSITSHLSHIRTHFVMKGRNEDKQWRQRMKRRDAQKDDDSLTN